MQKEQEQSPFKRPLKNADKTRQVETFDEQARVRTIESGDTAGGYGGFTSDGHQSGIVRKLRSEEDAV